MENDSTLPELQALYVSGPDSLKAAQASFGGPQGLLRSAAAALQNPAGDHGPGGPGDSGQQEIRALTAFAHRAGLMMDARGVQKLVQENFLGAGMEHQVGVLRQHGRVVKDYDPRTLDEETFETFYKPTDSLFDYLTDHILSNHIFSDDVRLEGFYQDRGLVHVVISQSFIDGRHGDKSMLIRSLEDFGLQHLSDNKFRVDGESAGPLTVTDVHEDNVLWDQEGQSYLIDVHFRFSSQEARLKALKALGLWQESSTFQIS